MNPIRVKIDARELTEELPFFLYALGREQIPYALAQTLSKVALEAKARIRAAMPTYFDRPTPYTLNSLRVKGAKKTNLEALVWVKDAFDKGVSAVNFVGPNVFGGDRKQKRSERALSIKGLLPAGLYIAPGYSAELDQYGNIPRGRMVSVLSALKSFGEQGYLANRTRRSMARNSKRASKPRNYFVAEIKSRLGVFERIGSSQQSTVKSILAFVRKPTYRRDRLPFFRIAEQDLPNRIRAHFRPELEKAIATAKPKRRR